MNWGLVKKWYKGKLPEMLSYLDNSEKVDLSRFRMLRGESVVLSMFSGVQPAKRAKLARSSWCALNRGQASKYGRYCNMNKNAKRRYRPRQKKFPVMTEKITEFVLEGWYSGTPVTRSSCYDRMKEISVEGDKFYKQHIDPKKNTTPKISVLTG